MCVCVCVCMYIDAYLMFTHCVYDNPGVLNFQQ